MSRGHLEKMMRRQRIEQAGRHLCALPRWLNFFHDTTKERMRVLRQAGDLLHSSPPFKKPCHKSECFGKRERDSERIGMSTFPPRTSHWILYYKLMYNLEAREYFVRKLTLYYQAEKFKINHNRGGGRSGNERNIFDLEYV